MSYRLYRELVERAIHFLRISAFDAEEGRFDIALFHIEQAVQLAVKAYLLKTLGNFPKIYSLWDLVEVTDNECLRRIFEEKWYVVNILDDAYIGGRYMIRRYTEREYGEAKRFAEGVFKCLDTTGS